VNVATSGRHSFYAAPSAYHRRRAVLVSISRAARAVSRWRARFRSSVYLRRPAYPLAWPFIICVFIHRTDIFSPHAAARMAWATIDDMATGNAAPSAGAAAAHSLAPGTFLHLVAARRTLRASPHYFRASATLRLRTIGRCGLRVFAFMAFGLRHIAHHSRVFFPRLRALRKRLCRLRREPPQHLPRRAITDAPALRITCFARCTLRVWSALIARGCALNISTFAVVESLLHFVHAAGWCFCTVSFSLGSHRDAVLVLCAWFDKRKTFGICWRCNIVCAACVSPRSFRFTLPSFCTVPFTGYSAPALSVLFITHLPHRIYFHTTLLLEHRCVGMALVNNCASAMRWHHHRAAARFACCAIGIVQTALVVRGVYIISHALGTTATCTHSPPRSRTWLLRLPPLTFVDLRYAPSSFLPRCVTARHRVSLCLNVLLLEASMDVGVISRRSPSWRKKRFSLMPPSACSHRGCMHRMA